MLRHCGFRGLEGQAFGEDVRGLGKCPVTDTRSGRIYGGRCRIDLSRQQQAARGGDVIWNIIAPRKQRLQRRSGVVVDGSSRRRPRRAGRSPSASVVFPFLETTARRLSRNMDIALVLVVAPSRLNLGYPSPVHWANTKPWSSLIPNKQY